MSPDEAAWRAAVRHAAILEAVEARLILAGAVTEVRQFYGLSASEVDVLLWQELHEPAWHREVHSPVPTASEDFHKEASVASGCPQTVGETVAA